MSINYEDFDEFDSDSSLDSFINIIEDQDGGTIVFNSSELMSANFDGGIPKTVIKTSIEAATNPLGVGDYIFWTSGTTFPDVTISNDDVDGELDESDNPADYMDVYLVTGIESNDDDSVTPTYDIAIMLEDDEYIISGVGGSTQICAIKEDWDSKELGTTGWLITSSGNAIFTNIAARGRIEATSGYLKSLDVNGVLRVKGTPVDPDGTEDEVIASLKVYQNDLYTAKEQGSVVVNKNGLIIRSKDPNTLQTGVNAEIIAKFPINGGAPKISGYTNDDGNPDDGNNPPVANESQIVIGGQKNNITINGGKGNKAIYTTINNNRTVFASPGSGETLTGFLIQLIDTDSGPGETWNTRMRLSGVNGSLTFDGSDLTVTGQIRATSGFIGGESTGWQITSNIINSVGGSTNKIYLVNDTTTPKITISSNSSTRGNHGVTDTPFYADSTGKFSLSNQLIFNPASGIVENFSTTATWTSGSNTITVASATNIRAGLVITGTNIPVATTVTNVSGTTITLSKNTTGSGSNTTVTFLSDDFGELNIAGRIRGVIDSVNQIISPRLSTVTESVSIAAASGGLRTITFTVAGHAFLPNERVRIEGLPTTNNLDTVNGQHVIVTAQHSKVFTISVPSGTLQTGTVTTSDGIITLQELTMGLHPEEGQAADSWYHTQGTGIRLDKFNWWFTNNQFRVGQQDSYVKWDGNSLEVAGDLYSYTGRIGSLYIEEDRMYVPRSINETATGKATNAGTVGESMTLTVFSGTVSTGNYVWVQGQSRPILIGIVSSGSGTVGQNITILVNQAGSLPDGTWIEGSDIRFTNTITDNMRYHGFGNTNTYSIFAGATTNSGTNSKFFVTSSGIVYLHNSSNTQTIKLDPNTEVSLATGIQFIAQDVYSSTSSVNEPVVVGTAGRLRRYVPSSMRYKTNIELVNNEDLNPFNILDINVYQYKYKNDYLSKDDPIYDKTVIGLIAEDVAEKYPVAVSYNQENGLPERWDINYMVPAMLDVIKNQQNRIDSLEQRLAILEG